MEGQSTLSSERAEDFCRKDGQQLPRRLVKSLDIELLLLYRGTKSLLSRVAFHSVQLE